MTDNEQITVVCCGPKLTCLDGTEHDYSEGKLIDGNAWTAVCSKCGHWAIDDAMWMD